MRRFTLILTLILGTALVATACGSDDDSTEVGGDIPTDGEDTDAPADEPDDDGDDDAPVEEPADDTDTGLALGAGPYPVADVSVRVDLGDGTTAEYRLACLGDTATFTGDAGSLDAAAACLALADTDVVDRVTTDQYLDRICTEIYGGPEVAQLTGTLDDQPIDSTVDRVNGCGIDDWDRLLAPLLPTAAGA
ncbi:MAG: hypothetical protein AAGA90_19415 [Actinomycetota bacterium]